MKPVEVLLIEDNAGDTLLIGQILADFQLPVKLHVARDGEQALQMLGDVNLKPSLIVLDLNIPKISGNALLRRYPNRQIPVVVFSSSWNEPEIEEALSLGAVQYVQKPTDIQAFTDAVCGMLLKWAGAPHSQANRATT
ncbi:MAG TPA: response regulator [Bryobacteraceae bacterium]|nr:response regulator [Bryobacteraceae bacterium]